MSMTSIMLPTSDYMVSWICFTGVEFEIAKVFLDDQHNGPRNLSKGETNEYALGRIGKHNVVIAALESKRLIEKSTAVAVTRMLANFPNVKSGILVGICGGAPSKDHDIRLGDVVVSSSPHDWNGGFVQYDFSKKVRHQ